MASSEQQKLPEARVKVPHPYLALMGLYLGGFAGMYSETALNIALPRLSAAFGVELALLWPTHMQPRWGCQARRG